MSLDTDRTRSLEREGVQAARVWWNLSAAALYEEAVRRREGLIAATGPLVCRTGPHTGRSPNDKFIVKEPSSAKHVAWGGPNRPIDPAAFDLLRRDLIGSLGASEVFVLDCFAGSALKLGASMIVNCGVTSAADSSMMNRLRAKRLCHAYSVITRTGTR